MCFIGESNSLDIFIQLLGFIVYDVICTCGFVEVSFSSIAIPFPAPFFRYIIPVNYDIRKKRCRIQSYKATLELLSCSQEIDWRMHCQECNSIFTDYSVGKCFCKAWSWVQSPLSDQKFKSVNTQMIALLLHCTIGVNWKSRNSAHPFHLMFYLRRMVSWITNSVFQLAPVTNQTAY